MCVLINNQGTWIGSCFCGLLGMETPYHSVISNYPQPGPHPALEGKQHVL